jgi:hypothetical protein
MLFVLDIGKEGKLVYGLDRMFWFDLFILLVIVILLLTLFNIVMRKWLKVEIKDFFHITI